VFALLAPCAQAATKGRASAQAAGGDRTAAKAFAQAAKELRADVFAQKATLETGVNRLSDDPACLEAFRHVPKSAAEDAAALFFEYSFEAQIAPIVPAFRAFVAKLEGVPVRDRKLRSGRASQRRVLRAVELVQPPPADVCAQLDAWRNAGYPADGAPKIDDPGFEAAVALPQRVQKRIDAAAKRLRKLGVSRRVSRLWTPDDNVLFEGIDLHAEVPLGEASP
jgi:hypothetical protein